MFLRGHTKEYNLSFHKVERCTKKIYSWAQSAPVQHDKETTSENLCVWTHNKNIIGKMQIFSTWTRVGPRFWLLSTFTFYHCYSILSVSYLNFLH